MKYKLKLGDRVTCNEDRSLGIGVVISPSGFHERVLEKNGELLIASTALVQFKTLRVADIDEAFEFVLSGPELFNPLSELLKKIK